MTAASLVALGIVVSGAVETSLAAQEAGTQEQQEQREPEPTAGEIALAEARRHMEANRWQQAIDAYERALTHLPGNAEAMAGLREAQARLEEAPILPSVEEELRVRLGRARAEFRAAMDRARELVEEGDFIGAEREALTAQIRVRQARELFSQREFAELNAEAEQLLEEIERRREEARLQEEAEIRRRAQQQQIEERREEAEARQRLIEENLRRVRQLQMELKYDEALQVIDEILFIDELNPAALVLRDVIRTTMLYRDYTKARRETEFGHTWMELENQRAMVPPRPNVTGPGPRSTSGVVAYPEDWAQLSLRRTHEAGMAESPANRRVSHVLSHTTIPVDFRDNTLEQVVNFLSEVTGQNIYVDWKALELIGVSRDDRVTLRLHDVAVDTALDRILEQVGDELDRPQWAIQDGIVTVSSAEALRQHTVTIVYDIRDLLFEVPYFGNAPDLDLPNAISQASAAAGSGLGGGFGGGAAADAAAFEESGRPIFGDAEENTPRVGREELVDQIVGIIQENIDPIGWRDLGGDAGTLQELNGNLIITNTLQNHREIEGLLSQLREIRALQINVESRFLTVSTDWFEQIGVDLDLFFNTNNTLRQQQLAADPLSHLSDLFDDRGRLIDPFRFGQIFDPISGDLVARRIPWGTIFGRPDTGVFVNNVEQILYDLEGPVGEPLRTTQGFTPVGVVQDSLGLLGDVAQLEGFAATVAGANPALATGFQFLDDIQVDLLIEATQADRRSSVMTAPRLTLFNGQRAWVAVATQRAFVSALVPLTGDQVGAFQPIPSVVSEGVVLDVEGVISADRRYVTMTVIVSLAEIVELREFEVQGAAAGGGDEGGAAAIFESRIELPEVEVSLVQTTVSVPDKGTVLLGGQRLVSEIEVEAGVPILSKIPFVNRFFTNRLTTKSEETLLILLRPEIIIQQEQEDLLFPGLSDTLGGGSFLQ